MTKTDKELPTCNDCHSAHTIIRTDKQEFRAALLSSCGKCHQDVTETYFQSYHGKASRLGSGPAAKCSDCHGSHNILPPSNPESMVHASNKLETCQSCHPDAKEGFEGYLAHVDYGNLKDDQYTWLDMAFWIFTGLIVGTFLISWFHTILFFIKGLKQRKHHKEMIKNNLASPVVRRFTGIQRVLHTLIIISFMTLAITGMALRYSYSDLSMWIIDLVGGVQAAGVLHRLAAIIQVGIFIIHLIELWDKKRNEYGTWKKLIFGPDTMLPTWKDWEDIKASIKWFLGRGPYPNYGRWIYWEKFDYLAEIWGIFFIGSTGFILWFPEFFTSFLPGEVVNLATVFHSFEALLATGFIFTIHFFNTHFRPEKFPLDAVIFTGRYTMVELEHERPDEYNRLKEEGKLEDIVVPPASDSFKTVTKIFGLTALTIGILVIIWISVATLRDVF